MKIGLVLSGGAVRGVAHIGVIQALEEMGLTFSCIAGTSAGSIVGALYSYGYKPREILDIVKQTTIAGSVRPAWTGAGLLSMDRFKDLLLKYMPANSFAALKIPLTICATELRLNEAHYITEGALVPAVLASCSVPAVFTPVAINGFLYVDGGVLDNLPVQPLKAHCDFIIGSHCNHLLKEFDPRNMKLVLERSMLMMVHTNTQLSKGLCDVVIEPPGLGRYSGMEIAKAQEIFDFAYKFTREKFSAADFAKDGAH